VLLRYLLLIAVTRSVVALDSGHITQHSSNLTFIQVC